MAIDLMATYWTEGPKRHQISPAQNRRGGHRHQTWSEPSEVGGRGSFGGCALERNGATYVEQGKNGGLGLDWIGGDLLL